MTYKNQMEVNLHAIRHNARVLKSYLGEPQPLYPVVKTNAYGLGSVEVTQALLEEHFYEVAVSSVKEAEPLQVFADKGLKILLLSPLSPEDMQQALTYKNWMPVLSSVRDLRLYAQKNRLRSDQDPRCVHVKFDVGLSRYGFCEEEVGEILSFFKNNPHIGLDGIVAHLPGGGDFKEDDTEAQIQKFKGIVEEFKKHFPTVRCHLFNTLSLIGRHVYGHPLEFGARIGGGIYGIKHKVQFRGPEDQKKWEKILLQPVLVLKSFISSVRKVNLGTKVSYQSQWTAGKPSVIAVVSMGYADGFLPSDQAFVFVQGRKVCVVGQVCMNCFMINASEIKNLQVGEEVVIYKDVQEFAESSRRHPYEVMTACRPALKRIYTGG